MKVSPSDHPVSEFEFDVLLGADGKRNTLAGEWEGQCRASQDSEHNDIYPHLYYRQSSGVLSQQNT